MKNIFNLALLAAVVFFTSCGEDFLQTENLEEQDLDNFYATPEHIDAALAGVYNAFFIPMPGSYLRSEPDIVSNILSDDMLPGGGPDDQWIKDVAKWEDPTEDSYMGVWTTYYKGIFRANYLIDRFDQVDYEGDEDAKNQALGEAHFMRAFYYFKLTQMFGEVPITEAGEDSNVRRSPIDDVYELIASDLLLAIDIMPATPVTEIPAVRSGHANKWTAEALMARVYLYYTGYSSNILGVSKDALPTNGGGVISKSDVQGWIKDMIDNSGHALISDQRDLWPYSYTGDFGYQYAADAGLAWAGEENSEVVFAVKYGSFGGWSPEGRSYVNQLGLFFGVRGNSLVPFGQGWGWGTVNPELWDAFEEDDPRKIGSIYNVNVEDLGYVGDKGFHETGMWNKKYSNIQYDAGNGVKGMNFNLSGGAGHFIIWNTPDQILIRYADVLLMAAELGVDADANLNAVRARSGRSSVPASTEAIRQERRVELCFEGLRYYDLLRWGIIEEAMNAIDVTVNNAGTSAQYKGIYRSETKGVLPIPENQILLSGGVLTQTPGW